jgi:glycyl-tRNA synthetase beta chain
MSAKNLLVELFVEELPPKALKKLGQTFGSVLLEELRESGLADTGSALNVFASPRRLAAHISHVLPVAPDAEVTRKVMPVAVALGADQQPTPAFRKAMAKLGRESLVDKWPDSIAGPDRLYVEGEGKERAVFFRSLARGSALQVGLQSALDEALAKLPIPKVMQYQLEDGWSSVNFVRPAHGLVALHGADVVPVSALGLTAGRETHGHRFEARMDPVVLQHADQYELQLAEQGAVIASFVKRRDEIVRQLAHAAGQLGLKPIEDDALLDEVTALVERPTVMRCAFEPEFLAVPPECLILTMKANQKYFPLLDGEGRLTHQFLIVSNIDPADNTRVVQGNERVVRPRLADAKFFFDQDRKKTLESRVPQLARVVYHGKLGSQGDRVERVRAIARHIGEQLGGAALAALADRAALLAKADLLTDMVGEFPELQGVMGGYYARHDGEPEAVAFAVEDHYKPRFAGDTLPRDDAGVVVALADKLETLAGLFAIGEKPSGDKDPFALRRHALGVLRMLIERKLPLELRGLVQQALATFAHVKPADTVLDDVLGFVFDRLAGLLREQGYSALEVDAVVSVRPPWGQIPQRLAAVRAFAALPEAPALAAANKRVGNILKKAEGSHGAVNAALLKEAAEQALAQALQAVAPRAEAAFAAGDYTASLQALAALKSPVDAFFDAVMVNAEDPALRNNRLALLAQLHGAMNRVADLAKLAT